MSELVQGRVEGPLYIITLNNPQALNCFKMSDYTEMSKHLRAASVHPTTVITLIQSSGRYFSSGANVLHMVKSLSQVADDEGQISLQNLVDLVGSPIEFFGRSVSEHTKPIIGCLNGPAVGLSAAAIAMCDIVFSMNDKVYLEFPFTKLGMGAEGATSFTLARKVGTAIATDALLLGTKIPYEVLKNGVISRNYNMNDTDLFNAKVRDELTAFCKDSSRESILGIVNLLRRTTQPDISRVVGDEMQMAMNLLQKGEPQRWFLKRSQQLRKQKQAAKM